MENRRYTDLVREVFDRIADLSEAEGWHRRVVMGASSSGVQLETMALKLAVVCALGVNRGDA